jgi:hypothetical protein
MFQVGLAPRVHDGCLGTCLGRHGDGLAGPQIGGLRHISPIFTTNQCVPAGRREARQRAFDGHRAGILLPQRFPNEHEAPPTCVTVPVGETDSTASPAPPRAIPPARRCLGKTTPWPAEEGGGEENARLDHRCRLSRASLLPHFANFKLVFRTKENGPSRIATVRSFAKLPTVRKLDRGPGKSFYDPACKPFHGWGSCVTVVTLGSSGAVFIQRGRQRSGDRSPPSCRGRLFERGCWGSAGGAG